MRDFHQIIQYLKCYYAKGEAKVYDKDIAEILGLTQAQFATLKKRNSTPYPQILKFCYTQGIECRCVFFED